MDTQAVISIAGLLSSVGSVAFFVIKGVMQSKQKQEEFDRSQQVNKADWLSWLAEAKKEVNAAKDEALAARRDAAKKSEEMIALIEAHRKEMEAKEALISRLQGQLNNQDTQLRLQSEEIAVLRRELATWKSKAPIRKEEIKEITKMEVKDEIAHRLTE